MGLGSTGLASVAIHKTS